MFVVQADKMSVAPQCGLAAVQIPYDSAAQDVAHPYDQALNGAQNP